MMKWVSGRQFGSTHRLQLLVIARAEIFGAFTFQEQNDFVGFGKFLECPPQWSASSSATASTLGTCVKIRSIIKEDFYNLKISSSYGLLRIADGLCVSENRKNQHYLTLQRA